MRISKENKMLYKRTLGEKVVFGLIFVCFCAFCIVLIYPLLWLIMSSLKDSTEYALDIMNLRPFDLPDKLKFINYVEVFSALKYENTTFVQMIFNSIQYIALSTVPQLFCTSLFGYIMAKYSFRGKELLFSIAIFTITIPLVGTGASYYVLIRQLNIWNTPLYPLVVNIYFFGSNFLFMHAVYKGISWSYAESVFIDGGGHWCAYFKVMLPQALPVIGTLAITSAIAQWNDYMSILLYMPDIPTVASGLYLCSLSVNRSGGMVMYYTGLVVSIIPVLALYIIFADKLLKNLSIGGLKG